jgi:hypothetical protein
MLAPGLSAAAGGSVISLAGDGGRLSPGGSALGAGSVATEGRGRRVHFTDGATFYDAGGSGRLGPAGTGGDAEAFFLEGPVGDAAVPAVFELDTGRGRRARFGAVQNRVTLGSTLDGEKLAVAYALSQAVKLNVFEARVELAIARNDDLAHSLAHTGKPGISKAEISRRIGQLFLEKTNVNLSSDLLESPEYFWSEGMEFKEPFDKFIQFLEVSKRVDLLNRRLEVITDLFDILNHTLDHSHMGKLNWIVIWLLSIELLLQFFYEILTQDLLGYLREPLL